jgi:hypothetical protein
MRRLALIPSGIIAGRNSMKKPVLLNTGRQKERDGKIKQLIKLQNVKDAG